LEADETLIPQSSVETERVHPVPPVSRAPQWPLVAGAAALLAILVVIFLLVRGGGGGGDPLAGGMEAYRKGDTAQAAKLFREAAERDPEAPAPRYYLAQLHREAGRTTEAARELQTGLRAAPRDPGLNVELGYLLLDQGKASEAADRFEAAVKLDPQSQRGWAGLVRALRASGRPDAADRVLGMAPPSVRALMGGTPTQTDSAAAAAAPR
ncbi:MAG TPA: tetratricopeptide repeat protein, partial [Longimicrobium sp.]|nr:tetratricopeptide repeat protein [Longimicrobium sp.]